MKSMIVFGSVVTLTSVAAADLPRSLSFSNQTDTRIVQTVAEGSSNEKEVEFGDVDLDGDMDIVIANGSADFGERKNKIYLNDGGVFTEVSATLMATYFTQTDVTRNAFIRDFDGDGWPDIYIINDSNSGGYAGDDHLFIAQHSGGVLTGYIDEGATRIASGGSLGAACGGVSADFDGDGDIDVYSGNYPGPSQDVGLYNNGSGFLLNQTSSFVPSDSDYTVDVAYADMNGDGKDDLLVSNDFDPNFIYYNDNNGAGTQLGDFRYAGSTQNLGQASAGENAMEPADFDNDGDMDFIWTNRDGSDGDRIYRNDGNDGSGKATFTEIDPIPDMGSGTSRKATVADFNEDGKIDVFVASQNHLRPYILRNTSVEGEISFVDWTPYPAIPSAFAGMNGWHGAAFDTGQDGDIDIVIGGFNDDHLLENTRANEVNADDLGGVLPALWEDEPVAVQGTLAEGESATFMVNDADDGFLSIVLNGDDDYLLEVLDMGGSVMFTIDRGGLGVEEATQIVTNGPRQIRVTSQASGGGGGCDQPADFDGNCAVDFTDLLTLLAAWGCTECPDVDLDMSGTVDFADLLGLLSQWGESKGGPSVYQLEVLGRS